MVKRRVKESSVPCLFLALAGCGSWKLKGILVSEKVLLAQLATCPGLRFLSRFLRRVSSSSVAVVIAATVFVSISVAGM